MRKVWPVFSACCLLLISLVIHADDEAMTKLERMGIVAQQLNYKGVFSYQTGNKLQSIGIIHRADDQGEIERLITLNGVSRELIRTNDMVTCVYPEGKPVQENHRPLGLGFPIDLLKRLLAASDYYQIKLGREERVASHHTQELVMTPIDDYRYGYHLWVDKQNDLLLQADIVDSGDVLESFAFSSVDMNIDIPDTLLRPQMQGNKMSWNRKKQVSNQGKPMIFNHSLWHIVWLPNGFKLVMQQNRLKARNGVVVEQRVYSDGLSSISVFFEKIRAQHGHLHGGTRRGIVNAFGTIIKGYFVTVVGEVPARTVEKVAMAITFNESK